MGNRSIAFSETPGPLHIVYGYRLPLMSAWRLVLINPRTRTSKETFSRKGAYLGKIDISSLIARLLTRPPYDFILKSAYLFEKGDHLNYENILSHRCILICRGPTFIYKTLVHAEAHKYTPTVHQECQSL